MPIGQIATIVGFAGMLCVVTAYAYLTASKDPDPLLLHGGNLIGAAMLAFSLVINPNLPSLVLEGIWACVACWGLYKALRKRSQDRAAS
ncbi:permease [Croceicoccus sp. F390]|uniref:Permease n=1 Tax=Croceicoccus esteveae TaxID=3075597 RepID=A0ABU2ZKA7_9SPHN|nr:permease [Croceicoccus sp. F390]MDT0576651.1 permease [Croceicoccus sp. F390]